MAEVELYTSRSRFGHIRVQLAVLGEERIAIRQTVSDDVAGTHFLEEKFTVAPGGEIPLGRHRSEVSQYRLTGQSPGLDNGVYRSPGRARIAECPSIVARLESHDQVGILSGGIRRKLYLHLRGILLGSASLRSGGGNIQKGKNSHFRAVNDFLEVFEAIRSRCSAVAASGDSRRQAMMIGNDRGSQVKPGVITTDVQVDQARRHIVTGDIHGRLPFGSRNIPVHSSYLSVEDGDIHSLINAIG